MKAIKILQAREIAEAQARGEEMFFDIPDAWYVPRPLWGCNNGHVSTMFLKSEEDGALCLECFERIAMLPHKYNTDEKLKQALELLSVKS